MLGAGCCQGPDCSTAASPGKGTAPIGGQAGKQPSSMSLRKAGPWSTWVLAGRAEEHLCEHNSTCWGGRHVERATEPARTMTLLLQPCRRDSCPASRNRCLWQLHHTGQQASPHTLCGGWIPWRYLSRAVAPDRTVPQALSPADLSLFPWNDLYHLSSRPVPLLPTYKQIPQTTTFQGPGHARAYG